MSSHVSAPPSSRMSSPNFLRNVLRIDALSCLACGLLQVVAPSQMARLMHLPQALVGYTGEFLLAYAAAVALVSTRSPIPRGAVWVLVAGNLGWALACVLLLLSGLASPNALGVAYLLVQAVTVALLAELQFLGIRHSRW